MPPVKMRGTAKPKNAAKTILRLINYLGNFKYLLVLMCLCVLISSGASVLCDSLLKPAINNYILPLYNRWSSGELLVPKDFVPFARLIFFMVSVFAVGVFASWGNARIMLYVSTQTLYRIRTDLFSKMETLPLKYYDSKTHGELMSLYTNDTDTLRDMMSQTLPQMFSSAITIAAIFVMMIVVSPVLALVVVVTEFFMLLLAGKIGKKSGSSYRDQQKAIGKLNGYIEEIIEGQRVVKVFTHEEKSIEEFNRLNDELCRAGTRANSFGNIFGPLMNNLNHVQYALVAITGAVRVITGSMDIGSIAAFLQYTKSFSRPVSMMSQQFNSVLNALAGAERIFNVIDEIPEADEGKVTLVTATETFASDSNGESRLVESFAWTGEWAWKIPDSSSKDGFVLRKLEGDVVFKDVSFSYKPEKEILHKISLHATPGKKIALVGSTGSGKTTITNLLTRFYDINDGEGSVTFDGIPLKEIAKSDLRKSLGMVLQDTHLFTGTIRDNIKYGNLDASNSQILAAAKLSNAHSFIEHLENGYDTVITGDGDSLSQGQRQLLAIARAAVSDPPVLILDEATSSIDTRTERLIEEGMNSLMRGRTVFVIAHRLSTVRNANEIIVLEKGNIIERGSHEELMKLHGRYFKLYTGGIELD